MARLLTSSFMSSFFPGLVSEGYLLTTAIHTSRPTSPDNRQAAGKSHGRCRANKQTNYDNYDSGHYMPATPFPCMPPDWLGGRYLKSNHMTLIFVITPSK
jgi:hypothetical protein